MATDLTIYLEDRPGTLAEVGEALGKAGVNIEGGCGFPCEGRGEFHVLVEDAAAAKASLEAAGIQLTSEREALVVDAPDQPGEMGRAARRLAEAGINIKLYYVTAQAQLVFGVDDIDKARGLF